MDQLVKKIQKEHEGRVYQFDLGVLARNVEIDEDRQFLSRQEKEGLVLKGSPIDNKVQFTKASTRENIANGETMPKIMGKISKVIGDLLSAGAGFRKVTDAVNQGTETDVVSRKALEGVDGKLGGISFEREGDNVYAVYKNGADTVRKKLGGEAKGVEWYLECEGRRDGKNTDGEDIRYGWISWFDISSVLPDCSKLTIGRDFFIIPASFGSLAGSNGLNLSLPFGRQVNISSGIDTNNWRASHDLENEKHYLTAENRTGGITVMCLFAPSAGKVYVMTSVNAYIGNIAIIKSDID